MAQIEPIYSIEKEANVYHNNSNCTERNNIETINVRAGTGGKRLCNHCQRLNYGDNLKFAAELGSGLFGMGNSSLLSVINTKQK